MSDSGLTLIELIIVIVVIGTIAGVVSPMLYSMISSFRTSLEITETTQQARSTFEFLKKLSKTNCTVTSGNLTEMTLKSGPDTYRFFVQNINAATGKIQLSLKKNSAMPVPLADNLARISGPDRPGVEFLYRNQSNTIETVTTNMSLIEIHLYFYTRHATVPFATSYYLDNGTYPIQN